MSSVWPGGASAARFVAEPLAGPMRGGREGGPSCPSGQSGKRPRRSKRNAIAQQTACWTIQHATFCFATASTVCPVEPWLRDRVRPGRLGESWRACGNSSRSVHHQFHLSCFPVSSQRLWLDGPATDSGFPPIALRQGLFQSKHLDGRLMFPSSIQMSFVCFVLDNLYQSGNYNVGICLTT